jgi:hypothetical protein
MIVIVALFHNTAKSHVIRSRFLSHKLDLSGSAVRKMDSNDTDSTALEIALSTWATVLQLECGTSTL